MSPGGEGSPAVSCASCGRAWNSGAMAEGLRLIGSCPRCGGALAFRDTAVDAHAAGDAPEASPGPGDAAVEPHLVLGIPRRSGGF